MAATTTGRVLEYLRDNPEARNAEIARAADCREETVRTLVYRLRRRNDIAVDHSGGKRLITVLKEPDADLDLIPADDALRFKREMYRSIAEQYFVDFIEAGSYSERLEIGRMICRILENF